MSKAIIYTSSNCPYCSRAKALLEKKNISYHEINIQENEEMREDMLAKSGGRRTVPQIFIGDFHVGGCDDLYALEDEGKLDELIKL